MDVHVAAVSVRPHANRLDHCDSVCCAVRPALLPTVMSSSTEQTENVREMFTFLSKHASQAVSNNVAHATATSNAWRDAVEMLPKTAGSLDTLLLQLGGSAGPIVARVGGVATVNTALAQVRDMKLVFDSPTRQMLLKKAVTALTNLQASLAKLPTSGAEWGANAAPAAPASKAGGSGAASSSSSAGLTGSALLNSPMPHIERATVVFDPANMRTGAVANPGDGINRNIKPRNMMTFSSAESSASARLGVAGKCAACGAHRDVGGAFCTNCGKNANIVFE